MTRTGYWAMACAVAFAATMPTAAEGEAEAVKAWEGTLTIPTYPWDPEDVNPHFQELGGRIIYPYTMQDNLSDTKVDRTYRALFLENEYLKVTCLPELGGRIHSVFDKTTQQEMFHLNSVIKPGLIAMRGAWISGGIEWNPGPHGHTVTIVSPVDATLTEHPDGSASVTVANTDQILGIRWTAQVTLRPGKSYLDESIRIANPTDGIHPYYFWNNTAFPCNEGTRYIYPMTLGTDHNGREFFSWPVHEGRDMTWLKNYQDMTSTFAYRCVYDFFGAYDVDADRGIVQYADHNILPGKKAWTWGQADFGLVSQESLTDDDGPYIEIQSGPLPTQSDYEFLLPRRQVAWQEWWYPVHGLGDGFEYATRDLAVQSLRPDGGSALEFRVLATGVWPGATVRIFHDDRTLLEERRDLSPAAPQAFTLSPAPEGPVEVAVVSADGHVLAQYVSPLPVPVETPPVFPPDTPEDAMTVEELYRKALRFDKDTNPAQARTGYRKALEKDPQHAPSLRALAVLDLESGRYEEARDALDRALVRTPDDGLAWCYRGIAALKLDDAEKAAECGYQAVRLPDWVSLGYDIVGRARMRQGRIPEAAEAFRRAAQVAPQDAQARDHLMMALWADPGHGDGAVRLARMRLEEDPLALLPRALLVLAGDDTAVEKARRDFGEYDYQWLTTAIAIADLGLYGEAAALLDRVLPDPAGPMPLYHRAHWLHRMGRRDEAAELLARAAALSPDYVFPSHPQSVEALRFALDRNPGDARAWLHLGNLYGGLGRIDESVPCWEKAAEADPALSVAWRNLGLYAWKKGNDAGKAEALYAQAIAARPDDEVLYRDRAEILIALERRPEAIDLLAARPTGERARADATVLLARTLVQEQRYEDAIALLDVADFSNWEGQTDSWDLFNRAHVERGKIRFDRQAYEEALADFATALTYPKNLKVGRPVRPREAEAQYWRGRALDALGRAEEARAAWQEGADGIPGTEAQDRHIQLCQEALAAAP